jgi:ferredoxin
MYLIYEKNAALCRLGPLMNATSKPSTARMLVCNCQKTMTIDAAKLASALGLADMPVVHSELCQGQVAAFEAALTDGKPLHVACTQEAPLFRELADAKGDAAPALRFTNIRERAGWSSSKADLTPKFAALLAEAAFEPSPARQTTLTSSGICLVYGAGQAALDAAGEIADRLSVSVLLSDPADALSPGVASVPVAKGVIRRATGRLGKFEIEVDDYAAVLPSSRRKLEFVLPRNGARSTCDVIIDLSGKSPLFADGARRDGYLRADPGNPAAVAKALLKATDLVGEFEKPMYVTYDASICTHSRSSKIGCSKCLDVCPTGAITPAGDHVAIDSGICGGCGTCAAVCPTGAASYAYPQRGDLLQRTQILLSTYRGAGGERPILLLHDERHGTPLIDALARYGDGLPANVLPLSLYAITVVGHDTLAACLALGAEQVVLLGNPKHAAELPPLQRELDLARAFLTGLGYTGDRLHLTTSDDPDALSALLTALPGVAGLKAEAFSFAGGKRDIARIALAKLHAQAPAPLNRLRLPKGAPYGRIDIKTDGCTLCLSCIGACPVNALADNPDRPEVAFTEAACVQCGICVATCPESVISLAPGYDFTPAAFTPAILKTEEPHHCIECGKAFGTKATINRVIEKLKGRHAMFQNEQQLRLIQMCDNCRVVTLSNAGNDPMRLGERPRVVTTADYLEARANPKKPHTPDDFLS